MNYDAAVRAWYGTRFTPTDLYYKCFDWGLVGHAPMIHGKEVLNLGSHYPLDEVALGVFAKRWVAIDFTSALLVWLKTAWTFPHPIEFQYADMRDLPFDDGEFDTVLDFSSSDHVSEGRDRVRSEAYRVLRPGGHHVVSYANRAFFPDGRRDAPGDFGYECRLLPDELVAEVTAAGFEIVVNLPTGARSGIVARKPV